MRQIIGDPATIKTGEGEVVGIIGSAVAERRQHAGIDPEFRQASGELGLVEKDVEAKQLAAASVVQNRQADVVRALREGKIAKVVIAGRKLQPPDDLPVDLDFNGRRPLEPEAAVTAGPDVSLRLKHAVRAEQRNAGDIGCRLEAAADRLQIAARPAHETFLIVVDQAGARTLEVMVATTAVPQGFCFDHDRTEARRSIQEKDRRGQAGIETIGNVIQISANVYVGTELRGRGKSADRAAIERAYLNILRCAALGCDVDLEREFLRIVNDPDPGCLEIGTAQRRRAGEASLQRPKNVCIDHVGQQIEQPLRREFDPVVGIDRNDDVAQIDGGVLRGNGQRDGSPGWVQPPLCRSRCGRLRFDDDMAFLRLQGLPGLRRQNRLGAEW